MASIASSKELEAAAPAKSSRTSIILNVDNKDDFTLCSLNLDKIEQQTLDLVMTEGESISFRIEGPLSIHLTGYYINDDAEEDDFINDDEEDGIFSDEAEEDSQIEYDSDLEDEDFSEDSEIEKNTKKNSKNPRIRVIESDMEEEDEEEDEDSEFDSEEDEEMDSEDGSEVDSEDDSEIGSEEDSEEEQKVEEKSSKKAKVDMVETKKVAEAPKAAAQIKVSPPPAKVAATTVAAAVAAKSVSPQSNPKEQESKVPTPVKKTLPSGLQIEDLKLGNGPKASQGKKVLIHYKGTLLNGTVFDSSFGGKPLKFAVGKGEVIKGMDMGIIGMAVGGSRKLTIPGPLAYGNQALPKIPRNSTLVFEIRLEKIL